MGWAWRYAHGRIRRRGHAVATRGVAPLDFDAPVTASERARAEALLAAYERELNTLEIEATHGDSAFRLAMAVTRRGWSHGGQYVIEPRKLSPVERKRALEDHRGLKSAIVRLKRKRCVVRAYLRRPFPVPAPLPLAPESTPPCSPTTGSIPPT